MEVLRAYSSRGKKERNQKVTFSFPEKFKSCAFRVNCKVGT